MEIILDTMSLENSSTVLESVVEKRVRYVNSYIWLPLFIFYTLKWCILPCIMTSIIRLLWRIYNDKSSDSTSLFPLPPGEYGIPLFGETLAFFTHKRTFYKERYQRYGSIFKTHLLGNPTIRLIGSDVLDPIMRQESRLVEVVRPPSVRLLLGPQAINSLSTSPSRASYKRSLGRALTGEALGNYLPHTLNLIRYTINKWIAQDSVLVFPRCQELVAAHTASNFLGLDPSIEDVSGWFTNLSCLAHNIFSIPIRLPFGLSGLSRGLRARKYIVRVIQNAVTKCRENGSSESVVGHLIGGKLNDEQIIDSMVESSVAGFDATSSAAWSIVMALGRRPDIVEKILQELEHHGLLEATEGQDLNRDVISQLNYVTWFVKETLRVTPPVGGAFRRAKTTFEVNGYQIPAGWNIIYAIRDTHDTSSMFDSDFRPERWASLSPEDVKYSYMPFSVGIYSCPGRELALQFLRVFTIELVKSTRIDLIGSQVPPPTDLLPTPRPKDGMPAKFLPRNTFRKKGVQL